MQLDIVLRTHDGGNLHIYNDPRAIKCSKQEIIYRCTRSLIKACEIASKKYSVNLTIIDDHSSVDTIKMLRLMCKNVQELQDIGNNNSFRQQYTILQKSEADVVYLVEDDYLHIPEALEDMLDTWKHLVDNIGRHHICLSPTDDPYNYTHYVIPTHIVPGVTRAWRSHIKTTSTFMTTPYVLKKYGNVFDTFADGYGKIKDLNEDNTWNKIWENDIPLFTPIVPLAYHLNEQIHPFYSYDSLWKDYE